MILITIKLERRLMAQTPMRNILSFFEEAKLASTTSLTLGSIWVQDVYAITQRLWFKTRTIRRTKYIRSRIWLAARRLKDQNTYMHTYMYIHTCIHTYIYTYIHTYKCVHT